MAYKKLWLTLALVFLGSFAVLLYYGGEIYQKMPPIPGKVVTDTGKVVGWSNVFLNLSLTALAVKMLLELGSAIPALEPLVFSTRSIVIGYLHLVLLGFVSCMILALAIHMQWLSVRGK